MTAKTKKRKKNTDLEFLMDVQHQFTAYALRKKYHLTESRLKKKLKAIGYAYVGNGRGQMARIVSIVPAPNTQDVLLPEQQRIKIRGAINTLKSLLEQYTKKKISWVKTENGSLGEYHITYGTETEASLTLEPVFNRLS